MKTSLTPIQGKAISLLAADNLTAEHGNELSPITSSHWNDLSGTKTLRDIRARQSSESKEAETDRYGSWAGRLLNTRAGQKVVTQRLTNMDWVV